ncbi:hypothetical protein KIPB_011447 [Kipferlia bialata]|uniref:Uncharacterized protein n=1 Tax=Kipferlia bialata TaxID=797122 RepID=A0A9K3D879_9EUKA|nr:hypothetical protein KIPB_011447 [Kipferlia bialata]|eukprot:g11447.t1
MQDTMRSAMQIGVQGLTSGAMGAAFGGAMTLMTGKRDMVAVKANAKGWALQQWCFGYSQLAVDTATQSKGALNRVGASMVGGAVYAGLHHKTLKQCMVSSLGYGGINVAQSLLLGEPVLNSRFSDETNEKYAAICTSVRTPVFNAVDKVVSKITGKKKEE